ncbi:MAG: hypothetical protein U0R52_01655 [Solirubrobacterales bacterium]
MDGLPVGRRWAPAFLIVLFALVTACLPAPPAGASFPGSPGRIAYSVTVPRAREYRLQSILPRGDSKREIFVATVTDTLVQGEPAYSADGRRVAFSLEDHLFVIDADGTDLRQLTFGPERDQDPAFAPDNRTIVFDRIGAGAQEIYSIRTDGTSLTRLTHNSFHDFSPTWSPTGKLIAFVSNRSGTTHVWLMRPDGSRQRILVPDRPGVPDGQVQPDFSPSGRRIAVSRGAHLTTMRLDGTHSVLLNRSTIMRDPTYSPDGHRIAAILPNRRNRFYEIVVMRLDGTDKRKVRRHLLNLQGISWQPRPQR